MFGKDGKLRSNTGTIEYSAQYRDFFAHFTPWENQQLGCVNDALTEEVISGEFSLCHVYMNMNLTNPWNSSCNSRET